MHQKDAFMLRSRICRLHFETDKVLCTYFVRYDMNDVTIPHAFVLRKTLCTTSSVSERGKPQCGDPEHRITLCEIYSIKTENIDMYIINLHIHRNF